MTFPTTGTTGEPHKRLLLIAFHFPPEGGSGTQRSLKFANYLPEFGWDVEVLTVQPSVHELSDASLLAQVRVGIPVHRTRCFDVARSFRIAGKYPGFLAFPDRYASWLWFGYRRGAPLLRTGRFDLIFSTSPIRTAHLLGWMLAGRSRLPWVCDFRDVWLVPSSAPGWREHLLGKLETLVLRRCSHVIANTPHLYDDFLRRFPSLLARRTTLIPNG